MQIIIISFYFKIDYVSIMHFLASNRIILYHTVTL